MPLLEEILNLKNAILLVSLLLTACGAAAPQVTVISEMTVTWTPTVALCREVFNRAGV